MSGGSMDYLYSKLQGAEFTENTPQRIAFRTHLELVAKALHDIEWVDSGDYGAGRENEAIMACISKQEVLAEGVQTTLRALTVLYETLHNVG